MKSILIITFSLIITANSVAQKTDPTALILIDIQNFYFPGGAAPLHEPEKAAENAKLLLNHFRKNNGLVVHIKHDFEPGGAIHKLVKPAKNEKVFTKNEINAFFSTDLKKYLDSNQIKDIVLCGMQTHMCLEAATRAAHDFGFNCTVIGDACATRQLKYKDITISAKNVDYSTLATLKKYATITSANNYLGNN